MAERPILFSTPMVRALLEGTKTQTRRVVKPQPEHGVERCHYVPSGWAMADERGGGTCTCKAVRAPVGAVGDLLWVRETWGYDWYDDGQTRAWKRPVYRADPGAQPLDNGDPVPWRPSIHMPRALSRITLRITDVRVERLNDISEADAQAEGAPRGGFDEDGRFYENPVGPDRGSHLCGFAGLWEHINGPGSWDANPFVWVVTFERVAA